MLNIPDPQPEISLGKKRLASVLRNSKDFVSVDTVVSALKINRSKAALLLARWTNQGFLTRIRRGLYAPVALAALGSDQALADPWLLVPQLFAPGYVGGWSAAEHWALTEQLFRTVCVLTAKSVGEKEWDVQGTSFIVKRIDEKNLFGLDVVWRGQTKIMVSSPVRTIIDMLDDPALGGGIRHVSECLDAYLARNDAKPSMLIEFAERLGNGAVFKRLGFLAARKKGYESLAEECLKRLTTGNAKLDPAISCKSLIKKWRLWIPSNWKNDKGT